MDTRANTRSSSVAELQTLKTRGIIKTDNDKNAFLTLVVKSGGVSVYVRVTKGHGSKKAVVYFVAYACALNRTLIFRICKAV